MAWVATRPNPTLKLGPANLSCPLVIVDAWRYDFPAVYASPGFITLVGYAEHGIIGRSCRFLQALPAAAAKEEKHHHGSQPSVA